MTDIIDTANDQAQQALDIALANAKRFDTASLAECIDCGEDIPPKRQQIGGVTRCIDCQTLHERRYR